MSDRSLSGAFSQGVVGTYVGVACGRRLMTQPDAPGGPSTAPAGRPLAVLCLLLDSWWEVWPLGHSPGHTWGHGSQGLGWESAVDDNNSFVFLEIGV